MAGQYFYARGDQQYGPFSGTRLKELATDGRLKPTDTVWKDDMKTGVQAGTVPKLFPAAPAEPSPDDTAVAPAKVPSPVLAEPALASPDPRETSAGPVQTIKALEPALELVPIPEDPEPPVSPDPDAPEKTIPVQAPPTAVRTPERKRRADAIRGATIISQDGTTVHYKKKCSKCGHEANSKNSMPIRIGSTTASFFCPKCKKLRDVVIRGSS